MFTCSNFRGFIFRGSYFRVLVVGRENRENFLLYSVSGVSGNLFAIIFSLPTHTNHTHTHTHTHTLKEGSLAADIYQLKSYVVQAHRQVGEGVHSNVCGRVKFFIKCFKFKSVVYKSSPQPKK